MGINFLFVGIGIIIGSWLIQMIQTFRVGKAMSPVFAILQFIGIALLAVNGAIIGTGMTTFDYVNGVSAICALVMFGILIWKK